MDKMLKYEYGSYSIPVEVFKLIELEEKLKKEGQSLDTIGFMPITHHFSYHITPPDFIPFAHTGGNGIHFGFLTDFGKNKDLNEAPIACVSPTDDPPIRYLARDIGEFLNLASSVPHVEMLENFWPYESTTSMESILNEFNSEPDIEWNNQREWVFRHLQETFKTEPLQVQAYVQEVLKERKEKIAIPTFDGLGIVGSLDPDKQGRRYSFDDQRRQNGEELIRMKNFLTSANTEEKLAFIRDAYFWYILTPDNDGEVLKLVVELLRSLKLSNEVNRLEYRAEMSL